MIAMSARTTMATPAMIQPVEVVLLTGLVSGEIVGEAEPPEFVGSGDVVCVGSGSGDGLGLGTGDAESVVEVGVADDDVGVGEGDALT
jgi:hypothetical protein